MADDFDFKQAMRGVRPLNKKSTPASPSKRQPDRSLRAQIQSRAHQSAELLDTAGTEPNKASRSGQSNEHGEDTLFFLSRGMQNKVLRELKKGSRYEIEYSLDLHGLTQLQAQQEIDSALRQLTPSRLNCLLLIHGKGLHSANGATLKTFTAAYLKTLPSVKAYCSAQQRDGGNGALYVLVKT